MTEVCPVDPVHMARMRWRCRRGLLELDIVLERFVEHYSGLDIQHKTAFDTLLDMPDTELWDMISGKLPVQDEMLRVLITLINKA